MTVAPRKSGSERRQRTASLRVRVTPAERERIAADAARAALSLGGYVRKLLLGAEPPRQSRRPPVERAELARLLGEIGRVGSNLNQLARLANSEGRAADATALHTTLAEVQAVSRAIRAALGR